MLFRGNGRHHNIACCYLPLDAPLCFLHALQPGKLEYKSDPPLLLLHHLGLASNYVLVEFDRRATRCTRVWGQSIA
jgi:hypothetical protein